MISKKRTTDLFVDKIVLTRTASEISDVEIKKYYEKNQENLIPKCESGKTVSQIVVTTDKAAKTMIEKLKAGEDFSALAKINSTDAATSQNGGTIACYTNSLLPQEFNSALDKLEINEISKQIKYKNSYYIFKVTAAVTKTYQSLKPEIKKIITDINNKKLLEKIESSMKKAAISVDSKYGYVSKQGGLPIISYKK